jgi:SAM-dependent methyltransferase
MRDSQSLLKDIIGWDVRNWSGCLDYWLPWLDALSRKTAKVLVLGERNGGISLWFAKLGFEVLCTDYQMPGAHVPAIHQRWAVQERIKYARADVFHLPHPDDCFDVVACKSVIGGLCLDYKDNSTRSLENQKPAVMEIRRVLKPAGIFLGAENLAGTGAHMFLRKRRSKKGNLGWRYLGLKEIQWLFDGYSECQLKAHGFLGTHWFNGRGLNGLCAAADGCFSKILPADWLYISFIRARK